MQRELKFRVWSLDHEYFVYSDGFGYMYFALRMDGKLLHVSHDKVSDARNLQYQLYTGLKDKNGKEIYEGDIVKHDGKLLQVVFERSRWNLEKLKPDDYEDTSYDCSGECDLSDYLGLEIVGNIFENPELIN